MSADEIRMPVDNSSMERLLTAVFMAIGVAVAITDEDLNVVAANVRLLQSLGLTLQETLGRPLTDFIILSDPDGLSTARAAHPAEGEPFEIVGRAVRSSAALGSLKARVEAVNQPGFKRLRVVTVSEAGSSESGASDPLGEPIQALVQMARERRVVISGAIKLIGLDEVRTALGKNWQGHAERVMAIAERIARRRLMPKDILSRSDDHGFVVCFAGDDEQEASFRAAEIAREIREFLIGEAHEPEAAAVSVVTGALVIEPGQAAEPESLLRMLESRLAAAREHTISLAEEDLQRLVKEARLEPRRIYDRKGLATAIGYAALPPALQGKLDVVAATLPPDLFANLDTELLQLTLAAEWAVAKVAALNKGGNADPDVRIGVCIVPLDFSVFATRRKRDALTRICRGLPPAVRQCLILTIRNFPRAIVQSRLQEIAAQIRPFARELALELYQASDVPSDLIQYRFASVLISATRLLDAERAPSVERLIARIHATNARLIALDATPEQVLMLTALGVDYHVLDRTIYAKPRKAIHARDGASEILCRAVAYQAAIDAGTSGFVVTVNKRRRVTRAREITSP